MNIALIKQINIANKNDSALRQAVEHECAFSWIDNKHVQVNRYRKVSQNEWMKG